jgi:hypothetical protein
MINLRVYNCAKVIPLRRKYARIVRRHNENLQITLLDCTSKYEVCSRTSTRVSQMLAMFSTISGFVEWTHGELVILSPLSLEMLYKFARDRNILLGHVAKQYDLSNLTYKLPSIGICFCFWNPISVQADVVI